jgi:hypothetical protein
MSRLLCLTELLRRRTLIPRRSAEPGWYPGLGLAYRYFAGLAHPYFGELAHRLTRYGSIVTGG